MDSPIAIAILLCLIDHSWTTKASAKTRVAVIGGGIGGTTAALFLREELGDDVNILIYEKDNRRSDRHRGTWRQVLRIWRRRNSSQKSIHVKSDKDAGIASRRGLPDPLDFRPKRPKRYQYFSSFLNKIRFLWRYGIDLLNLNPWIKGLLKWYNDIYPAQEQTSSYTRKHSRV